MRRYLPFIFILGLISFVYPQDSICVNKWHCAITNYGWFGMGHWPYPERTVGIFGAGVWIGTFTEGETLVSYGYNPNNGRSEMVPSLCRYWREYDPRDRVYKYPGDWPPPKERFPMAPVEVLSDMDLWTCFNDSDPSRHDPNDTRPIGIDIALTVYGFADSLAEDFFFLKYEVRNPNPRPILDAYLGIVVDADIIRYTDDLAGFIRDKLFRIGSDTIRIRNTGFIYDSAASQAMALRFLSSSPDLGMRAFRIFAIEENPRNDRERYQMLSSVEYDSLSRPMDQRILLSVGPFHLLPDSCVTFYFAIIGSPFHPTDTLPLVLRAYWAERVFRERLGIKENFIASPFDQKLKIYPNPFSARVFIFSPKDEVTEIDIYNTRGERVKRILGSGLFSWDGRDEGKRRLPSGIYFLKVKNRGRSETEKLLLIQ